MQPSELFFGSICMNKYLFICETNNKIMEELHACRVCLGTDVKLFNMFQYNLVEAYESISNTQVDALDGRPHMLCNCCAVLLRRSAAFQHRCLTSQRLLNTLAVQQKLTTELIKNYINRDEHKLSLPYSISNNELISLDKHDGPQTSINDNLSKTINDNKTIKLENEYDTSLVEIHIENDNSNTTIKNETDNKYFEPYKVDVDIKVDAIESDNHSNLIDEGISYEYMNDSDSSDEPIAKKAKKKLVKTSAKKQSGSTTKKQQNSLAKKQTVKNVAKSKRNTNSKAKNDLKNGEIKKVAKPRTRKVKNESKSDNVSNKDSKIKDKDHSKVADDSKDEDDSKVDKDDDNLKECLKNMDMKILTLEEQKAEVEARKLSDSYKLSPYKCDICYKGFRIETTYKNHMWLHDPACGSFVCPVCGVRARNSGLLSHHRYATHHARFSCRLCAYVTKVKYNATAHCKWHDGHMFICKTCGASFSKQTSFLSHVRARHSGAHACACGAQFVSAYGLHLHKKKAHRESAPKSDCPTCGAQFCSSEALRVHCEGTCDSALKPCVYCGLSFSEATLQEHVKTEHTHKMIHCKECNKSYTEAKYRGHYEGVHLRRRRGAPPAPAPAAAVCEVCGRVCKSRAFLVAHQRRHTGEKPFSCSICPKRFAEKERLQQHIRVHTGERPYKCTLCPKAFQQRSGLNRHRRVHDGSKPYECSHCGKAFSQSNSMKLHIHTVHLKLPTPYRPSRQRKSNVQ